MSGGCSVKTILLNRCEKIAVLKLNRGTTNAIDFQLIDEMKNHLERIREDSDIRGVVLTSTNEKFFAIGFDIPWLMDLPQKEFRAFYHAFNQLCLDLYTFPKPTIAAITGHAVAGGCILALCCDYRYIADGRKLMGLNEIKIGVPLPYPTDYILRDWVGSRVARDMADSGEYYESDKLLQMGVVDRVVPVDRVLPEAVEKMKQLGSYAPAAFRMIKRNRVERVKEQILEHLEERERYFVECWYSEETRRRLEEIREKF